MTISEQAVLLRDKLKYYPQNKKVLENFENHLNNVILTDTKNQINSEFKEKFESTGYISKNNCTYSISFKDNKKTEKLLCNFVACIDEEITVDDGLETYKIFKIRGKHERGYDLPSIDVSENDFISMNWIIKKWGARCILETGQAIKDSIRCCIQKISKNIKDKTVFSFTGWKKLNGKWIYLHSDGAIGADNIEIVLEGKCANYKLPKNVLFKSLSEETQEMFADFTEFAMPKITLPLLAFTFLTPLNEFLRQAGYEPNFVYYLLGKTGCGKSTISALFLSFFGNFSSNDLPLSFMDTPNAIINKAFEIKDCLLCIDDFMPSGASDMKSMNNTAQKLVRAYGERTGRNRLKSDSTAMKVKYPRGNVILTGEQTPNIGESGTARMVISEISKGSINFDSMAKIRENTRNNIYSGIMKAYIEWIQRAFLNENEEIFIEILKCDFEKYRNHFLKNIGKSVHSRVPSMLAFLKIGFKYLLEFCSLEKEQKDTHSKEFDNILEILAKEHYDISLTDKPTFKFISTLKDMIASGTVKIEEKDSSHSNNNEINKTLIGYYDNKYYYFIPKITYNQICRFYNSQGENFPTSQNALLKQLAEEGFIKTEHGRNTLVKNINHKVRGRFIYFYKEKFDDFGCMSGNEVTEVTNITDDAKFSC